MKKILNLWIALTLSLSIPAQVQIGGDIDGEAAGDFSGSAVAISADGNQIAIGGQGNDDEAIGAGHVRVYEWNGSNWIQMGADIDGVSIAYNFGLSVDMTPSGTRLVVGAYGNNSTEAGFAHIYDWNGTNWVQVGSRIEGEAIGDSAGNVSISSNGNIVAIGAQNNDGSGTSAGHCRIYEWNGSSWVQLGADIDGTNASDNFGEKVSLSGNGTRLAIGASRNSDSFFWAGHVRIYEWNGGNWIQMGATILGVGSQDLCGSSLSLSENGERVAIGARFNDGNGTDSGQVRIFEWDGTMWSQLGLDIYGTTANDRAGTVSLSSDGKRVAIGGVGNGSGQVRTFEWDGSTWSQVDGNVDGEAANDGFGNALQLNANGEKIVVGAPFNDGTGGAAGHARSYSFTAPLPVELIYFKGYRSQNQLELIWQTATEINNKGFQIQKSRDGSNWQNLIFVPGKGTSSHINNYSHIDSNPYTGQNYYRLQQQDYDGTIEYSNIVNVLFEIDNESIMLYPNPASNTLFVQLPTNTTYQRIPLEVFNQQGQSVAVFISNNENMTIDISTYASGIYWLKIGRVEAASFVKFTIR